MTDLPAWGELWWCEFREIGRRPVLVRSRDVTIQRRKRCMVAPSTTTVRGLSSEAVLRPGDDPVRSRSAINLDSIERGGGRVRSADRSPVARTASRRLRGSS